MWAVQKQCAQQKLLPHDCRLQSQLIQSRAKQAERVLAMGNYQ